MPTEKEIRYRFSATENVTSVAGRVRQALKSARKSEGAEALEEISKIARGAGVLAGLDLVAGGLERITSLLKEMREESLKGPLTTGYKVEKIAEALPFYGKLIAAGRELRKELDGTNKYVEKIERRAKGDELIGGLKEQVQAADFSFDALQSRLIKYKDLEADLIDLQAERQKARDDLAKKLQADSAATNNPGQRAKLREEYDKLDRSVERITTIKAIAAVEADRAAKVQQRFSIAEKGVEFLQQEAELGKVGTANDAARLKIAIDYARKREEIGVLLKRDNLTPEENDALRATQRGLGRQERETIANLSRGDQHFSGGLAPTQQSSFLTGVAAAGRENNPAFKIAASTDAMDKNLTKIFDLMLKSVGAPAGVAAYQIK